MLRFAFLLGLACGCTERALPLPLPLLSSLPLDASTLDAPPPDSAPPDAAPLDATADATDGALAPLTLTPPTATVGVGRAQLFTTNRPAALTVTEPDGGSIDGNSRYLAPAAPGIYHVVASAADGATATATVTVVPLELTRLSGTLGGSGDADDIGTDARLNDLTTVASDAQHLYVGNRSVDLPSGQTHSAAAWRTLRWSAVESGQPFAAGYWQVWRMDPLAGATTPLAGDGNQGANDGLGAAARFVGIRALLGDGHGHLFVIDGSYHGLLRRITADTGAVTTIPLVDRKGAPFYFNDVVEGYGADADGLLYFAQQGQPRVVRVDPGKGTAVTTAVSFGYGPDTGYRFLPGDHGLFYAIGDTTLWRISLPSMWAQELTYRLDPPTLETGSYTSATEPGDGGVYLARGNVVVDRVDLSTHLVAHYAGLPPATGFVDGARDVARFSWTASLAAAAARVIVSDANTLRAVDPDGQVTTLAGAPPFTYAWPAMVDGVGMAARFVHLGGMAWSGASLLVTDDYPIGFVGDHLGLRQVTLDGTTTTAALGSPVGGADIWPPSLVAAAAGRRFITVTDAIWEITDPTAPRLITAASQATCPMPPTGGYDLVGLAAGDGVLYLSHVRYATISQLDLSSGAEAVIAGQCGVRGQVDGAAADTLLNRAYELAVDGLGHLLFLDGNTVRQLDLATHTLTTLVGAAGPRGVKLGPLPARLNTPSGLTVLDSGDVAIADERSILLVRPALTP